MSEHPAPRPAATAARYSKADLDRLRNMIEKRRATGGSEWSNPLTCAEVLNLIEQAEAALPQPPASAPAPAEAKAAPAAEATAAAEFWKWLDTYRVVGKVWPPDSREEAMLKSWLAAKASATAAREADAARAKRLEDALQRIADGRLPLNGRAYESNVRKFAAAALAPPVPPLPLTPGAGEGGRGERQEQA